MPGISLIASIFLNVIWDYTLMPRAFLPLAVEGWWETRSINRLSPKTSPKPHLSHEKEDCKSPLRWHRVTSDSIKEVRDEGNEKMVAHSGRHHSPPGGH